MVDKTFGSVFQGKKVVVTGNTGFKGSWLTVWLLELGADVVGISKDVPTQPSMFEVLGLEKRIKHYFQDIRDLKGVCTIIHDEQPDIIFHLAAQPIVSLSYKDPVETMTSNIIGTTHILESLRTYGRPCSCIIITSDKCYDNVEWTWGYRENDALGGKDPYSASKGAAELIVKTYFHSFFSQSNSPIKVISVRAGNVIGGGDWADSRIVPDCVKAWSVGKPVELRNPNATRPWQHVLEPLSGYLRGAQLLEVQPDAAHGESFNFGPSADQSYTVYELLNEISTHWSFNKIQDYFMLNNNQQFHEAGLLKLNCDKALHYLAWRPTLAFSETAALTATWYDSYYKGSVDMLTLTSQQIGEYTAHAQQKNIIWSIT